MQLKVGSTVELTLTGEVVAFDPSYESGITIESTVIRTSSGDFSVQNANLSSDAGATVNETAPAHVYADSETLPYPGAMNTLELNALVQTPIGIISNFWEEMPDGYGIVWRFAGDPKKYTNDDVWKLAGPGSYVILYAPPVEE